MTSWKAWSLMRNINESMVMPAFATSTRTGPHRSSMVAKAESTSKELRTSQRTAKKRSGSAPTGGSGGSAER